MSDILTCAYCGKAYPEGTPPYGADALTEHIKICDKHPMGKLRKALADLVGASTIEELKKMEETFRCIPGIEKDKIRALNAIHALIDTA